MHIGESFGGSSMGLTSPAMPLIRDEAESFEQFAVYAVRGVEWMRPEGAVTLRGAAVTPSMFPLLRATPHLGRLFSEEDGRAGAEGVALLSYRAWTARFALDPDIVGTVLTLDDRAAHRDRGAGRGVLLPEPRRGNLDALRD